MYHLRQFRPAFYLLVSLGVAGFCLTAGALGLFVLAGTLIVLNAYLVHQGRFRPVPRLLANLATITAGGWAVMRVSGGEVPIEPVGTFLVVLQIVKLFEQRGNRDFGQLIVLSLLTMVAAAMMPGGTSLLFGMMLLVWVILSLYTCLLFHLKVEADAARRYLEAAGPAMTTAREAEEPRLRQDERRLSSSLRRLTGLVAVAGVVSAVVVFLAFPRGGGASFLHDLPRMKPEESVTGFSGNVDFQDIARIQQNNEVAAHVEFARQTVGPLYFRGNALDFYQADADKPDRWSWSRTPRLDETRAPARLSRQGMVAVAEAVSEKTRLIEYAVELQPTGSNTLFVLDGTVALRLRPAGPSGIEVRSSADGTISVAGQNLLRPLEYVAMSTGQTPVLGVHAQGRPFDNENNPFAESADHGPLLRPLLGIGQRVAGMRLATLDFVQGGSATQFLREAEPHERVAWMWQRLGIMPGDLQYDEGQGNRPVRPVSMRHQETRGPLPASDAILAYVLDPAVSGVDEQNESLARQRLELAGVTELDAQIAANVEADLRNEFDYSLDVSSDAQAAVRAGRDPLDWFVTDGRRGHCELFAGTMALALQSLGIEARVVVGYRVDEYNERIGRWTIRQSNAHAWVEALTTTGWRRYDPTPAGFGTGGADEDLLASIGTGIRQLGEYLTYTWQQSVIGYDRGAQEGVRDSLFASVDERVGKALDEGRAEGGIAHQVKAVFAAMKQWLADIGLRSGLAGAVVVTATALLTLLLLAAGVAVVLFISERWRLRRRARRIGLDELPPEEARRLAKQLGFYDDMVQLLEGLGYRRRAGLTPREFAATLDHLPPAAFEQIGGLTEVFYRVRFGDARVTPMRRTLLRRVVDQLAERLTR